MSHIVWTGFHCILFCFQGEDEADGEEDNNDDDDGFFVPHGYLSDDEGVEDDEMEDSTQENDEKVQYALMIVQGGSLHFQQLKAFVV